MIKFADKPNADVEYLSSGILHAAMVSKFNKLFGRDPVQKSQDEPMVVIDTVVPNMILDSVDHEVAAALKASAVEHTLKFSAEVPEMEGATLLYTVLDDDPATVSLEAVPEYKEMSETDATVSALNGITVKDGIAYVDAENSGIEIGVFVSNEEYAAEFMRDLENAGGAEIGEDEKRKVFDDLFNKLPGGESLKESDAKNTLLKVVGLTATLPNSLKTPDAMLAPGPQPNEVKTETV